MIVNFHTLKAAMLAIPDWPMNMYKVAYIKGMSISKSISNIFPFLIISNFHFICSWLRVAPLLMSYSGPRGRHWDNKNMEKLAAARLQIEQKSSETFWQKFNLSNIQPKFQDPHPSFNNPSSLEVCASSLDT